MYEVVLSAAALGRATRLDGLRLSYMEACTKEPLETLLSAAGLGRETHLDGLRLGVLHLMQLLHSGQGVRCAARLPRVVCADARAAARLVHQVDCLQPTQ